MEKIGNKKPPVKGAVLKKHPVTGEMYWDCPAKPRREKNEFAPKWGGNVSLPLQARFIKPGERA